MNNTFIDAHAHLLNENYILREVLTEGFSEKTAKLIGSLNNNFKLTSELAYTDLISKYKKVGILEKDIKIINLTYDLDYIFQEKYEDPNPHNIKLDLSKAKNEKEKNFYNYCNLALDKKKDYHYSDFLKENECLKKKYHNNIYLFYYFDPRRSDALKFVENKVRKKGESINAKKYIGVKLYPQNGYSPLDPEMHKLYAYCQKEEIPITLHFSDAGFSSFANTLEVKGDIMVNGVIKTVKNETYKHTFKEQLYSNKGHIRLHKIKKLKKERARTLNHPFLWHIVMEQYKNLRINFAHFGNGSKTRTNCVLNFIAKYDNAYTDLSCAKKNEIRNFLKKVKKQKLENKILFGSDYALNELFTLKPRYIYKKLHKIFPDNYQKMTYQNSNKFLRFDDDKNKTTKVIV